jgi:hypothetical protein
VGNWIQKNNEINAAEDKVLRTLKKEVVFVAEFLSPESE